MQPKTTTRREFLKTAGIGMSSAVLIGSGMTIL